MEGSYSLHFGLNSYNQIRYSIQYPNCPIEVDLLAPNFLQNLQINFVSYKDFNSFCGFITLPDKISCKQSEFL